MTEIPNIVRERLKAAQAGEHPDANLLTAFSEQALPDRERVQVLDHLARCADCRSVLVKAAPPISSAALPGHKDTAGASKVSWLGWATLRWGALAACVVIVGTAVFVRHDLQTSHTVAYMKSDAVQREAQQAAPVSSESSGNVVDQSFLAKQEKREPKPATKKVEADRQIALAPAKPGPPSPPVPASSPSDFAARAQGFTFAKEGYVAPAQKDKNRADENAFKSTPAVVNGGALPIAPPTIGGPVARKDEILPLANAPVAGRNTTNLANPQAAPKASEEVQVSGANETVEVQAAAVQAETTTAEYSAKKATPGKAKGAAADASVVTLPKSATSFDDKLLTAAAETRANRLETELARGAFATTNRWTISSDGQLQHSLDSGKTWQPVAVADKATFRALSANGPDLWVGGAAGLLYHSSDAGAHWIQIRPVAEGTTLAADIATIEFTDRLHGELTTSTGEVWITPDAGKTWRKRVS